MNNINWQKLIALNLKLQELCIKIKITKNSEAFHDILAQQLSGLAELELWTEIGCSFKLQIPRRVNFINLKVLLLPMAVVDDLDFLAYMPSLIKFAILQAYEYDLLNITTEIIKNTRIGNKRLLIMEEFKIDAVLGDIEKKKVRSMMPNLKDFDFITPPNPVPEIEPLVAEDGDWDELIAE